MKLEFSFLSSNVNATHVPRFLFLCCCSEARATNRRREINAPRMSIIFHWRRSGLKNCIKGRLRRTTYRIGQNQNVLPSADQPGPYGFSHAIDGDGLDTLMTCLGCVRFVYTSVLDSVELLSWEAWNEEFTSNFHMDYIRFVGKRQPKRFSFAKDDSLFFCVDCNVIYMCLDNCVNYSCLDAGLNFVFYFGHKLAHVATPRSGHVEVGR